MAVPTDQQVAAFRAVLNGDLDRRQRQAQELMASGAVDGLAQLIDAAFVLAVRREFSPTWSQAKVVRYVAELRALISERQDILEHVDARTAENLIRRALGDNVNDVASTEAKAWAQFTLLMSLTADLGVEDDTMDDFVAEARRLTISWAFSAPTT